MNKNQLLTFDRTISIGKFRIRFSDCLFLLVFLFLAIYSFAKAPYGITNSDESLFQLYNYRLLKGDHLFSDDWMIGNLTSVFTYLPYRVYTMIFGGPEGVLLALRYLYYAIKMLFFLYLYFRLREYGAWGVLAGAICMGTDLFGMKTTSYYSVCLNAVVLAGMFLFVKRRTAPIYLIAAGFLFSCAVIVEPQTALVWLLYSLLVLIVWFLGKRGKPVLKDYTFILSPKVWRNLLYGICAAAVMFLFSCAICFTGTDLKDIFSGLSTMLTYATFDTAVGYSTTLLRLMKVVKYAFLYNPVLFLAFFVVFIVAVPLHRFTKKHEKLWFSLLVVLFMLMSVRLILLPFESDGPLPFELITMAFFPLDDASGECASHPMLLFFIAFAAYTFTKERSRRLFAFMLLSFAVSAAVDIFSNNTFGSMLLIASVPSVLLIRDYFKEQWALRFERRTETKENKGNASAVNSPGKSAAKEKPRISGYACLWLALICFIPSFEIWHWFYMGHMHETERGYCASDAPLDTRIEDGVLKGIITTRELAENNEKSVADAVTINETGREKLWVIDYDTTVYFNAGVSVCSPAIHLTGDFWGTEEAWWEMHPEKRPDIAYVPFSTLSYLEFGDISSEEKLSYLREHAEIEVTEGKIGYIVKINRWY